MDLQILGSAQVVVMRCGGTKGSARYSKVPTLFQIAFVDTGTVRWVNADLVSQIALRD